MRQDATTPAAAGAAILGVNAGVPGADETPLRQQVMRTVLEVTDVPLSIDTADSEALGAALLLCEGKAFQAKEGGTPSIHESSNWKRS